MSDTCYLCVELTLREIRDTRRHDHPGQAFGESAYVVTRVCTFSEKPQGLTRDFGDPTVYACFLERSGDSYQEALDSVRHWYPIVRPDLAERFPLPVD